MNFDFTYDDQTDFLNAQLQAFFSDRLKQGKYLMVCLSIWKDGSDEWDESTILIRHKEEFKEREKEVKKGIQTGKYLNYYFQQMRVGGKSAFSMPGEYIEDEENDSKESIKQH